MITKARSGFLFLAAALVLGIFIPLGALAQTTLFSDDFGPKPLASWRASPLGLLANWDASSGAAVYNGGGHTQLYTGSSAWTDYKFQVNVKLANGSDYPGGIRGRIDANTGAGYAAWLYPAEGVVKLFRSTAWHIDTSGLTLLAQASVSGGITSGVFHTLALDFSGSQIAVIFDGSTVIQTTDTTLAAGAVALDVSNQPITYDDVAVTSGTTTLFADDFSPRPLRNWTPSPLGLFSNWDASTGVAAYNGGGHTQIIAGSNSWTDYTVEGKFRLTSGSNYPGGLRGRVNTTTGESYAAWIYPGDNVIKLFRVVAWNIDTTGLTLISQANVGTITTGVFHKLAITFHSVAISVALDDTSVIQASDSSYAAGAVALDTSNQPIDWDDVKVTALPPASQLFADDFGSLTLANWMASPLGLFSNWSAAGGTAAYNGGGHTQIYAGSAAWTDYKVEAKFRLANGSNYPGGLRGRVNTSTGESYAAWLYPGDGVIKLYRAAAWNIDTAGLALLAQANVAITASAFHDLSITFVGSQITVNYDGTDVIQTTDTVLTAGAIALDVSNQPIEWDDVTVTQLGGGSPPPPPPPADTDNGPGGPILVISKSTNPFTRYAGEILLAEGLNQYAIQEIGTLDAPTLANYDVAILGETALTAAQVTMLTDWVNAGGHLVALRPDAQLAGLLGITPANSTLANGYLLIDAAAAPGQGLVNETIQFHGTADLYTLNGAAAVATLYSTATTATTSPAVTLRSVGASGGKAAAFTYDLARSVVYTRQGNPAWAGQERDGVTPKRSDDLFFGAAAGDPQTDWIDLAKVAIPQADEQQRLLVNLILTMNAGRKPLPRFWYLPRGLKAAVVMTGDDHGNNGTQGRFEGYESASPAGCNVANWECVRATSYIYPSTPLPPSAALAFQAEGFEIGVHVSSNCADWTTSSLESFFATQLADFATLFPGVSAPVTNRTHCIAWSDWATEPKTEKAHGIRFDTNYYYWPGSWIQDRPGFFTGSGLPMRFADLDGTRIDVYQATTQMTDESGQSFPFNIDTLLDNALGSLGYYGVMTANMHTDTASHAGSDAIVASAQSRGVPIVSSQQMLTWLDGRNGSSFSNLSWSGTALSFTITAATGADGLQALLPNTSTAGTLASLTRNGSAVTFTTQTIKGIPYAVFPAASGSYVATYAP
ncbi:MAG TPA: family 16 glycoside hydrolase [Thermoanaerobaculia bacterium]|nr:family 16 glycoside hydrolase [Thermoanaerobaculia bacterium]